MGTRLLTTSHAGRMLGLSAWRVAQLFDDGTLKGVRDSAGRRLITEGSVKDLQERRKITAAPVERQE